LGIPAVSADDLLPQGWNAPAGYTLELRDPPARCRSCRAEIAWSITPAGRRMPLDRDGVSHFATCPYAAEHRRKR
jgi:hypothetical protein